MTDRCVVMVALLFLLGCGSPPKTDASFEAEVLAGVHQVLLGNIRAMNQAARDLQAAAPTPAGRGWDSTDEPAIDRMKEAWIRMRAAWEVSEGALAPLFPALDESLDARYEDYLEVLGPGGDANLFDGQGVIGMHAMERILYAPVISPGVVAQEATLPGYQPAAWPATAEEAETLKSGLCAQLVADTQSLIDGWNPRPLDLSGVFEGLTSLMAEQEDKVSLANVNSEESRYARRTLADLRDNLRGTRTVYDLFVPWLLTKVNGTIIDDSVQQAFDRLDVAYSAIPGDAIPTPPPTWSSLMPTLADQQTPFGKLYVAVVVEVDPNRVGSAVDAMNHVAQILGLPLFTGEPATGGT